MCKTKHESKMTTEAKKTARSGIDRVTPSAARRICGSIAKSPFFETSRLAEATPAEPLKNPGCIR